MYTNRALFLLLSGLILEWDRWKNMHRSLAGYETLYSSWERDGEKEKDENKMRDRWREEGH